LALLELGQKDRETKVEVSITVHMTESFRLFFKIFETWGQCYITFLSVIYTFS
jgi:hypothetical protein